jgi:glycosyltransferase involved in cell wall biosynthesis
VRVLHINLSGGGIGVYGRALDVALKIGFPLYTKAILKEVNLSFWSVITLPLLCIYIVVFIKLHKIDVIVDSCGKCNLLAQLAIRLAAFFARIRYACIVHDPSPHSGMESSKIKEKLERAIESSANLLIVHGEVGAGQLKAEVNRNAEILPHTNLYSLVGNASLRARVGLKNVLFFGALRPNKGVELLPEYASLLRGLSINLTVAGSSSLSKGIMRTSWPEELDVILGRMREMSNVDVIEKYLDDDEVAGLIEKADAIILPYKDATQSGVLALAATMNVPVVATDVGDMGLSIKRHNLGVLSEYSAQKLFDATVELSVSYSSYSACIMRYNTDIISDESVGKRLKEILYA